MDTPTAEQERFAALFHETAPRVRAYVRRHTPAPAVDEVVADTYLIAWRRRDVLPAAEPLPWLLVTARQVIANRARRKARTEVSGVDLERVAGAREPADETATDRSAALAALAALSEREREALLLVAWDGLDHRAAAAVAGCSVRAFTVRLQRARQRLTVLLDETGEPLPDRLPHRPVPTLAQELS